MKHIRSLKVLGTLSAFLLPYLVFAQNNNPAPAASSSGQPIDELGAFIQQFIGFIDNYLVPLLFAIAFIVFIFGIFRYFILGAADEEKRTQGRSFMLWGLIGFFVMVSIWGILNLLVYSFGFGSDSRPDLPTFEQSPNSAASSDSTDAGALPSAQISSDCRQTPSICPSGYNCNKKSGICQTGAIFGNG